MKAVLIILALLAIASAVYFFLIKSGKIEDEDGDFIPDVVEDKVEDIKEDVEEVISKAKNRVKEVKEEVADVVEELDDVVSAIKGKVTKSKLRSFTKQQLVDIAKTEFNQDLDISNNKTNLINKVYGFYHKK